MKYKLNGQWVDINIKALDSMPIGAIIQFAGDVIPNGWLVCDGSSLNKTTYAELFTAIGTKYGGSGNNFNLPNFKGKVAVGQDTSQTEFDTLGETGGSKNLQAHTHKVVINSVGQSQDLNKSIALYNPTDLPYALYSATGEANVYPTGTTGTGNSGNLQPYLVVNYIIKVMNTVPVMATVTNTRNDSTDNVYSCNYVNTCNNYSTSEIDTGKVWIDGKKIYRKVYYNSSYSQNASSTVDISFSLPNLETITNVYGSAHSSNTHYVLPNAMWSNANGMQYSWNINAFTNNGFKIMTGSDSPITNFKIYLIIEYTKTS